MQQLIACLFLLAAAALASASNSELPYMQAASRVEPHPTSNRQLRRLFRKHLLEHDESEDNSTSSPGGTYKPDNQGEWESGGGTGIIMIHANLMKDGGVVGWSARNMGLQEYGSAVYNPASRTYEQLLDECGIHDCKNSFCGGQTLTADNEVLIFGGHAQQIQWFRSYHHGTGGLWSTQMNSGRWYPTPCTLGDGKVLVVGGVAKSGKAGYHAEDEPEVDNPTYEVYDPETKTFDGDHYDMQEQLSSTFPIHTYPHVHLLPDGGVAVSAGNTLVKYNRTGPTTFVKDFSYPSRPSPPWSYPQTGVGTLLPMQPPYDKVYFMAAGGSSEDRARPMTLASDKAEVIELTAGADASWVEVGPMPYKRVMGDAIVLCDGSIGFFGGAEEGIAGWSKNPIQYEFRDGTSWYCEDKCSKADGLIYEPTIFDPATGKWSEKGSLALAGRPRLYHAISILLPDCKVMVAGSDVTNDKTAEIYSPPYLSKGPQPEIKPDSVPDTIEHGTELKIPYYCADPVDRAILIRNGAITHSMAFDARALWLNVTENSGCELTVEIPSNRSVLPPGLYMLVILSDKGVPSTSKIVSIP